MSLEVIPSLIFVTQTLKTLLLRKSSVDWHFRSVSKDLSFAFNLGPLFALFGPCWAIFGVELRLENFFGTYVHRLIDFILEV